MKLLLTGGGTGGHVYPALAVGEILRQRGWEILYVGSYRGIESRLVSEAGVRFEAVASEPVRKGKFLANVGAVFAHTAGFAAAAALLRRERPNAILGTGGFVSFPVCAAALAARIPVILHESNAHPGKANVLLARGAAAVLTAFPPAPSLGKRALRVGVPVRKEFFTTERNEARRKLGVSPEEKVLLVFGGSRGAASLNGTMAEILPRLDETTVFWGTGEAHHAALAIRLGGRSARHHVLAYLNDMYRYVAACDLAVTRAGAMTLAELAAAGTPSVLIPYPHATGDHQMANALSWEKAGAAVVVSDAEIRERLYDSLVRLMADRNTLGRMALAARALAKPYAAELIADEIAKVAK